MLWIEILQLRATKESALAALIEELGRALESERVEYTMYRHVSISTDFSVHLVHKTDGDRRPDQTLGQRLAATLSEHGLISHSLWVETYPQVWR